MSKKTAIFLNGGAGRMISSIPAVEKYLEEIDLNMLAEKVMTTDKEA